MGMNYQPQVVFSPDFWLPSTDQYLQQTPFILLNLFSDRNLRGPTPMPTTPLERQKPVIIRDTIISHRPHKVSWFCWSWTCYKFVSFKIAVDSQKGHWSAKKAVKVTDAWKNAWARWAPLENPSETSSRVGNKNITPRLQIGVKCSHQLN